jgi:hypothetical protein
LIELIFFSVHVHAIVYTSDNTGIFGVRWPPTGKVGCDYGTKDIQAQNTRTPMGMVVGIHDTQFSVGITYMYSLELRTLV